VCVFPHKNSLILVCYVEIKGYFENKGYAWLQDGIAQPDVYSMSLYRLSLPTSMPMMILTLVRPMTNPKAQRLLWLTTILTLRQWLQSLQPHQSMLPLSPTIHLSHADSRMQNQQAPPHKVMDNRHALLLLNVL
jgi:hypothetical protein